MLPNRLGGVDVALLCDGVPVASEPLLCRFPSFPTVLRVVTASSATLRASKNIVVVQDIAPLLGRCFFVQPTQQSTTRLDAF